MINDNLSLHHFPSELTWRDSDLLFKGIREMELRGEAEVVCDLDDGLFTVYKQVFSLGDP